MENLSNVMSGLGLTIPKCRSILIVDDEPANLDVLQALLEDQWDIYRAEQGIEALKVLAERPEIDLVISDQRMPGMTGVDLLAKVAKQSPETVRMVLTAYSDVDPIVNAMNKGSVYRFLLKPWDSTEMMVAVEDALALKASRAALIQVVEALMERRGELRRAIRDLETAHERLAAAERIATLGHMTSGIVYDIRNQLMALNQLIDAIQAKCSDTALLDSARRTTESCRALLDLVSDIGAFAKASRGLHGTPVNVAGLIEASVNAFGSEKAGSGRSVKIQIDPQLDRLYVEGSRVQKAILALLRNASQASSPSDPIELSMSLNPEGSPYLEVKDQGIGMSAETLQQAPGLFFSAFEPRGVGLGLQIVQTVAQEHGGRLELNSELGGGTRARIVFGRGTLLGSA